MIQTAPKIYAAPLVAATALFLCACAASPEAQPASYATAQQPRQAQTSNAEGALKLEWQAPDDRMDGAPLQLSDIAGYRIYIGDSSGQYTKTIDINDAKTTRYLLQGLQVGKEYFVAISTIDKEGRESPKSGEAHMAAAPLTDIQTAKSNP